MGRNSGSITNSYAAGKVTGNSYVGGILGAGDHVKSSYYDKDTTHLSDTGKGDGKSTAEMQTQSTYIGWDFTNIGVIDPSRNNGYPFLQTLPLYLVTYLGNGSTEGTVPFDGKSYTQGVTANVVVVQSSNP